MDKKIVIIGAGVAGMTSAIYLKRAGFDPLLIEAKRPGGQINLALKVENYPGFSCISGRELSNKIFEQVTLLGIDYLKDEVLSVQKHNNKYLLTMKSGNDIESSTIFIATGKRNKQLKIPNANDFIGVGLSYCATCDGMFFKGKDVLVVGDTNKAVEEAIYLAEICNKVIMISDKNELSADCYYKNKLASYNNIEVLYNTILRELNKDSILNSALILKDGKEEKINISGCFACVGYVPNSELFRHLISVNGNGYIIVDKNKETSCKGIYAVGDVTDTDVYQLVTAASDAVIAVNSYLKQN